MENYYLRHYTSKNKTHQKTHHLWLVRGGLQPGVIDNVTELFTLRYCHVKKEDESIITDILCQENDGSKMYFKDYDVFKKLLLDVCDFLNSGKELNKKIGKFYISEFRYENTLTKEKTYTLNLIKTNIKTKNNTRENSGGFINSENGDVSIFDINCFGYKMKLSRKRLLQQICNALNEGAITF